VDGGFDRDTTQALTAIRRAETTLARARPAGRPTAEADALARQAHAALDLVRRARGAHNPLLADAPTGAARQRAEEAARLGSR
jgi:hypothetical protein